MSDVDSLLAEYRTVTKAERSHDDAAKTAARRRTEIIRELNKHLRYTDIGRLVGLSQQRVSYLATRYSE